MFGREFVGIRLYISVERLGIMPFCVLLLKKMFTRNESQWAMIPYKVFDLLVSRGRSQVNFNRVERISPLTLRNAGVVPRAKDLRHGEVPKSMTSTVTSVIRDVRV